MEQIFSVFRRNHSSSLNSFSEWMSESNVICSISNCNTMAFTSTSDLRDTHCKWWAFHVYVVDLNMPYHPYKVTTHSEEITSLEWDISGTKLLIGDVAGNIQIWTMRDYLISEWSLAYTHAFAGERILSAVWFHNGIKLNITYDKKDLSTRYTDKYVFSKFCGNKSGVSQPEFGASVRQFGGKPTEGCLTISSSGLVCCLLFLSDGSIISGMEILGQFRTKLNVVDVCYAKNGDFLVVTTNGCVESSIDCFRVTVKVNHNSNAHEKSKVTITCQPYTSFYMSCSSNSSKPDYKVVSHLKFVLREAAEAVIIAASGASGSTVELWELREKSVSIHKMFNAKPANANDPSSPPKTVVWQHSSSSPSSTNVVAISTPRSSLFDTSPPPSYILVAYSDNTINCFYRENLHLICSANVSSSLMKTTENSKSFGLQGPVTTNPLKSRVSDMQFTWSSCAMVAIDSLSQIFVYRLSPVTDPAGAINLNYAQTMLEFCLISGNDWLDVILALKPNLIDSLCDKLTDTFMNKQTPQIQQKWLSRFLTMKASLYRCLNTNTSNNIGQCKAGDFYTLIMLNAIATTLKSLLRPSGNSDTEGPAENLSMMIQSKGNEGQIMNIDKVLLNMENKDFCVEPAVLQSFQHLHQWIADLTLYLLASLPQQLHNNYKFPGGGLISDPQALNTLRELFVIIRIWGLLNPSCLPVFTKMQDNLDVIALLFKLLSKKVYSNEPYDEALLDECCLLPNQVLIPQLDLRLKAIGIATPALMMNKLPLQMEYLSEPSCLKYNVKTHSIDGSVTYNASRKVDVVRYVGLGSVSSDTPNLRSCSRCNSVSLLKPVLRSAATRAWDQRWIKNCLCGGYWRINAAAAASK